MLCTKTVLFEKQYKRLQSVLTTWSVYSKVSTPTYEHVPTVLTWCIMPLIHCFSSPPKYDRSSYTWNLLSIIHCVVEYCFVVSFSSVLLSYITRILLFTPWTCYEQTWRLASGERFTGLDTQFHIKNSFFLFFLRIISFYV